MPRTTITSSRTAISPSNTVTIPSIITIIPSSADTIIGGTTTSITSSRTITTPSRTTAITSWTTTIPSRVTTVLQHNSLSHESYLAVPQAQGHTHATEHDEQQWKTRKIAKSYRKREAKKWHASEKNSEHWNVVPSEFAPFLSH